MNYYLNEYLKNDIQLKQLQDKQKKVKEKLLEKMKNEKLTTIENKLAKITKTESTIQLRVDSKKLKEKYQDIYKKCTKEVTTSESLRITYKGGVK